MADQNKGIPPVQTLRKYFGIKEEGYKGKQGVASFMEEIRELSYEEKVELAEEATLELNAKD